MLQSESSKPSARSRTSIDTPTTISGSTRGIMMKPTIPFFRAKRCRAMARAVPSPRMVLPTEADAATATLFMAAE